MEPAMCLPPITMQLLDMRARVDACALRLILDQHFAAAVSVRRAFVVAFHDRAFAFDVSHLCRRGE